MKKTALVTGGAGFLGSHLCDRLLNLGFKVICLDNLITGNKDNISHLLRNKNFKFYKVDINKCMRFKEKLNFVLHFASPASPADYLKYPIETLRAGSFGTNNVLELAREKKARFLLASTSEVYGDPLVHPQKEDYLGNVNCIGPRSVYDEAKRFAEALTMAYYRTYGVDTRIVRIFNTYGPRMRKNDGRAIPNFISQALNNEPLTVYGRGFQTRSFCYVDDLIDGIIRLLISHREGKVESWINLPINLGNQNEMKLIDLAKTIISLSRSKSKVDYKLLPIDDPKQRRPDITKARKHLKWQPTTDLKKGLIKTIEWFSSQPK